MSVPKDSIKVDVNQIAKPADTNWISIAALLLSSFSFLWIELRTNKKESEDKKNSKNDLFWFRTIISPNLMEPLFHLITTYESKFNKINQIEDEDEKDDASTEFSEQWDLDSQLIIDKTFLLTSIPDGVNIQNEINEIMQTLLLSFTSQLYDENIALPENNEINSLSVDITSSTSPFGTASKDLMDTFKKLMNSL